MTNGAGLSDLRAAALCAIKPDAWPDELSVTKPRPQNPLTSHGENSRGPYRFCSSVAGIKAEKQHGLKFPTAFANSEKTFLFMLFQVA